MRLLATSAAITALAFLLSFVVAAPFSASLSAMFSGPEKTDFMMSDLFVQVADGRPVRQIDDRIVLIDVGQMDRENIARTLEEVALCCPKAVGIDINFAQNMGGDEADKRLLEAISSLPGVVLPLGVAERDGYFTVTDRPFFGDSLRNVTFGIANMPGNGERGAIRDFAVDFLLEDGRSVPSFVVAVAEAGNPNVAWPLRERGQKTARIAYASRDFTIIDGYSLDSHLDELDGKYVLIGATADARDMHATPVSSYMVGLLIHAYALSTLLDGHRFVVVPPTADYVLAVILCFIIVLGAVGIRGKIRGLTLRIAQVALLYLAVRTGYSLYVDHDIICNFSYTLLMITFGIFAADVWNGMTAIWEKTSKKFITLKSRHYESI